MRELFTLPTFCPLDLTVDVDWEQILLAREVTRSTGFRVKDLDKG